MIGYFAAVIFASALSFGALAWLSALDLVKSRFLHAYRPVILATSWVSLAMPFVFLPIALHHGEWWPAIEVEIAYLAQIVLVVLFTLRHERSAALGSVGAIVAFTSSMVFAVNYLMPEPFSSTMFPLIIIAAGASAVLAIASLGLRTEEVGDLATMLFASAIFFAYVDFAQLLIIWIGHVPHEITFYRDRLDAGLLALPIIGCVLAMVVPIVTLIFRPLKMKPVFVGVIAALALCGHVCWALWWAGPDVSVGGALVGFIIIALVIVLLVLGGRRRLR